MLDHSTRKSASGRFRIGTALAVAGLMLATAGCAADGDTGNDEGLQQIRFQLDWVKNHQFAGLFVADENGWYEDAGMSVEFLDGGDIASTAAVIAGGGAEMGIVSNMSRLVDAINEEADLVVVGTMLQQSPAGLMTLPDLEIDSAEDLVGLRIGTDEAGQNDINALFKVNGLDPDWEHVRVGFDAAPLFEDQIDAYYAYVTSQPVGYLLDDIDVNTITFADLGFDSYGGLIVTTSSFLEENEQLVRDFLAASARGFESAIEDPAAAVEITMNGPGANLGLDAETSRVSLELQLELMVNEFTEEHGMFALDMDRITGSMYDSLLASGRTELPDANDIFKTGLTGAE